jgi:hypothetical protein
MGGARSADGPTADPQEERTSAFSEEVTAAHDHPAPGGSPFPPIADYAFLSDWATSRRLSRTWRSSTPSCTWSARTRVTESLKGDAMIDRLVIFGGTGDLMARYLLPGLGALRAAGLLSERFAVTAAGREDWDSERFRGWAARQLDRHAPHLPAAARQALVPGLSYRQADVRDPGSVQAAVEGTVPGATVQPDRPGEALRGGPGERREPEPPAGQDNVRAGRVPGGSLPRHDDGAERAGVPDGEPRHRAHLEQRAYRRGGDQLLCLIAMEPPVSLGERDLRDRKVDVLRSVHPLSTEDAVRVSRRARYSAGRIGDRQIPAYVDEDGVDPRDAAEALPSDAPPPGAPKPRSPQPPLAPGPRAEYRGRSGPDVFKSAYSTERPGAPVA